MVKPFNIQSPENIAKEYAGNKQRIAEAMQMGVVDPTAGVLAGMFIDRMRAGQMQEGMPQSTVAQQVMGGAPSAAPAPPLPAGGLGATPQAAPSMTPEMGMGMPPEMGMAPQGQMPMMAEGGLATLPVPDTMFDEPTNGGFNDGYAGGGIVAFQQGGGVFAEEEEVELGPEGAVGQIDVVRQRAQPRLDPKRMQGMEFDAPSEMGGFRSDVFGNLDILGAAAPRQTKRAEELEALLERERSPEERAKRRKEDMYMALAQIGAKMATTPGSLLQAAGAGIQEALPGVTAAAKERRGEERALTRELLSEERAGNKEQVERFQVGLDMVIKGYIPLEQALQDRNFRERWETMGRESQERIARMNAAAGITQSNIGAGASMYGSRLGYQERRGALAGDFAKAFDEAADVNPSLKALRIQDPKAFTSQRSQYIDENVNRYMPALGGSARSEGANDPLGIRR